jgi:hypothetical protein
MIGARVGTPGAFKRSWVTCIFNSYSCPRRARQQLSALRGVMQARHAPRTPSRSSSSSSSSRHRACAHLPHGEARDRRVQDDHAGSAPGRDVLVPRRAGLGTFHHVSLQSKHKLMIAGMFHSM